MMDVQVRVLPDPVRTERMSPSELRESFLVDGLFVPGRLQLVYTFLDRMIHTHPRRVEAYLYFDLAEDAVLFHFMGRRDQTRHLVVRNGQAVLSPSWSIHSGCGTSPYRFVWAMGGENQEFDDMDPVGMGELR